MNAVVRRASARDADAVWRLVHAFAVSFVPTQQRFDDAFEAVLGDDTMLALVAVADDQHVVGYLLANRHRTFFADGPIVWVEEVMVDPAHRRSGVATALMDAAEEWAAESAAAYVSLATRRAADFYTALGYEESATFFRKVLGGDLSPR